MSCALRGRRSGRIWAWPATQHPHSFCQGRSQRGVVPCNPVDGVWRPNREGKWSLRSQENVTAWRYLVLESDRGDISAGEWLAFLVALQLPIAAICETGGRLPHALVRVDAASKEGWDRIRDALAPLLIMGGADPDALSAVRLTRLPGCERLGLGGRGRRLL